MQPVDFTKHIKKAELVKKRSGKTGNDYYMVVLSLDQDVEFAYIALKGEENAVKLLVASDSKKVA